MSFPVLRSWNHHLQHLLVIFCKRRGL
uniref:Uncharacterized protein n=1 Tax=Arundo donax TaxID=35708 RepID=A0A0A9F3I6_ARUDO